MGKRKQISKAKQKAKSRKQKELERITNSTIRSLVVDFDLIDGFKDYVEKFTNKTTEENKQIKEIAVKLTEASFTVDAIGKVLPSNKDKKDAAKFLNILKNEVEKIREEKTKAIKDKDDEIEELKDKIDALGDYVAPPFKPDGVSGLPPTRTNNWKDVVDDWIKQFEDLGYLVKPYGEGPKERPVTSWNRSWMIVYETIQTTISVFEELKHELGKLEYLNMWYAQDNLPGNLENDMLQLYNIVEDSFDLLGIKDYEVKEDPEEDAEIMGNIQSIVRKMRREIKNYIKEKTNATNQKNAVNNLGDIL